MVTSMITIAEPYTRFDRTLGPTRLEDKAAEVLAAVEGRVVAYYFGRDLDLPIRVFVRLERGSTRAWVTITTVASVLVFYGDIRQSVDYLIADAKRVATLVLPHIQRTLGTAEPPTTYQRRLGLPGQLHRLFSAVERHEMSSDEATSRAVELLYEREGPHVVEQIPRLTERLAIEMRAAVKADYKNLLPKTQARERRRRLPPPVEALPPRRRTGVIVERDEKTGQLRVNTY
jgi:hypothetical protein